jgi:hypothetical protein
VVVVRARDKLCGYAGRNQQSRTPICKLIPQGERCNLSKNSFFHCIRGISIYSNLMFARLPTFGYLIKWVNCNKYSHLGWRHRYSSLSLCNNDLVHWVQKVNWCEYFPRQYLESKYYRSCKTLSQLCRCCPTWSFFSDVSFIFYHLTNTKQGTMISKLDDQYCLW